MISLLPSDDTIAAIATALAPDQGSIAIIKVSGSNAQKTIQNIVHIPGKQEWESHKILYGHVIDSSSEKNLDEVIILIMKRPRSFTGEDVVEIHCHGGLIAVQRVFKRVLEEPKIRRAEPGEFSQRAVLNGRLNLTQAEAINQLIAARCEKAAQIAMSGIDGIIDITITNLKNRLIELLSELEARVDFEDELPPLKENLLIEELTSIQGELTKLIKDTEEISWLNSGLKLALIGRPNVGKSSLMNRLSKRERSIVTEIPGTTRDLVESDINIKGIPVKLIDTAGIRETKSPIEEIGVKRSQNILKIADLVLLVFDSSTGWTKEDELLFLQIPKNTPRLIVGNKSDIKNSNMIDNHSLINNQIKIFTSALTGAGEEKLIKSIFELCGTSKLEAIDFALNNRQNDLAKLALLSLINVLDAAEAKLPWDFWTIDLRQSIKHLNELTGEDITETVLDRIFSKFCIGK